MKEDDLFKRLMEVARNEPEDDSVPYAFEKRIMATLESAPIPDPLAQWASALWRACIPCVVAMLIIVAVSSTKAPVSKVTESTFDDTTSEELEFLLLSALETEGNNW
ncbi:hypothetical protein N9B94_04660 [Verrucomicrobia bacterium]|nr:hypothetical protein [Verrucomicrobiota bacterium]